VIPNRDVTLRPCDECGHPGTLVPGSPRTCPGCQAYVASVELWLQRRQENSLPSDVDRMLRIAREQRPDLWARTEAVARIIDPSAFADDWLIDPPEAARLHRLKLEVLRGNAVRRAQEVLQYLGVNTECDWYDILTRLVE